MTLSDLKQDKTDDAHLELGLREGEDSTAAPHPSGRRPDPPGGATLSAEAAAAREAELDDDDEADKEPLIKWRALLNWRTYAKRKYIVGPSRFPRRRSRTLSFRFAAADEDSLLHVNRDGTSRC